MKKMKGLIIVVVVLVSLVAVISAYRVKEFSICTDTNHQCDPAIYRNIVVWTDFRTAVDLYGYDLSTSTEFQMTADPNNQCDPAIYGNIVVWEDRWAGVNDIYGYDMGPDGIYGTGDDGGQFSICTDPNVQRNPAIYGNIVVWADDRNDPGNTYDIYGYNLSTSTEFPICTNTSSQYRPAIYGNTVVWHDYRNGNADIYGYNLSTSTEFAICTNTSSQYGPAIYGNTVVWHDYRNGNADIYGYSLSTSTEFQITTDTNDQSDPAIYENIVVWQDWRNDDGSWTNDDIYGYNLATHTEFQITTDTNDQSDPAIYENIVVWEDDRNDPGNTYDIYGAVLEEEAAVTANPIAAFIPLKNYHLRQVNTCLGCIEENLPEDVPEDVQTLLDEMQEHINNANTTGNTIYANNELLKALKCCEDIQEKLGITCAL